MSLRHHPTGLPWDQARVVTALTACGIPALLAACGASLALAFRSGTSGAARLVLAAVPPLLPVAALAVHAFGDVPYPVERTALYAIPLGTLAALAVVRPAPRALRVAADAALAVLVLAYVSQVQWTHFRTCRFDAASRDVYARVRSLQTRTWSGCPGMIASSWQ